MKTIILILTFITSLNIIASDVLTKRLTEQELLGDYNLKCVQTQSSTHQGFLREVYQFKKSGKYEHIRSWFKNSKCHGAAFHIEITKGDFKLGEEVLNNGFNPRGTYSIKFLSKSNKIQEGVIWVSPNRKKIRLSKSGTMLGLFNYSKK